MIEYLKTTYACRHIVRTGSTFGLEPEQAEENAREAGYLVEENVPEDCPDCKLKHQFVPVI